MTEISLIAWFLFNWFSKLSGIGNIQGTKCVFSLLFLGYDRTVPGKPRYSVLGTDNSGEFSLQITDVQLDDDADYECQVGPALYNQPIRHKAHLTVQCKS